jgi:hypothetical protein
MSNPNTSSSPVARSQIASALRLDRSSSSPVASNVGAAP